MAPSVAVVGAGIIGCAAARELSPAYDVRVLERNAVGSGATDRGAGEVTMTPSYTDHPAVATHANDFFRTYDGTGEFWFVESGSLELVAADREDEARRRADRLSSAGFDVDFLDPDTVESRYPRFDASDYAGAVYHGETGFMDPSTLVRTLADDARQRGAAVETGVTVTGLAVDDGTVQGVETTTGVVPADHVVVAAGWRTPDLLDGTVALPIRPYRTQCAVFRPERPLSDSFPMGWVPGEHVYFRRTRDGELLVGGWSFAEDDPETASRDSDPSFRLHAREWISEFLDPFEAAPLVDDWAGVDGATPDTRPVIDAPENGPDGLVIAAGFHGRGIMTSPAAATAVRSLVSGERTAVPLEPFGLDRFDDRARDFEFTSISDGSI